MRINVTAPGNSLEPDEIEGIERDLEKIDRRLKTVRQEVSASVRVNATQGPRPGHRVVLEVDFGRNHLLATAEDTDVGRAVREAREEILRQINDRSRGGHSSFAKHL